MVVGLGEGENFIASDAMALVGVTDKIVYLDDGDIVSMTKDECQIYGRTGNDSWQPVERKAVIVQAYAGAAELGPYRHYMQRKSSSSRAQLPIRSKASKALRRPCLGKS